MSHDTHTGHDKETERRKSKTSLSSSFWFIVILVVLFVSALNFVNVMSNDDEGEKKETSKTEAPAATENNKSTPVEKQTPADTEHKTGSDSTAKK